MSEPTDEQIRAACKELGLRVKRMHGWNSNYLLVKRILEAAMNMPKPDPVIDGTGWAEAAFDEPHYIEHDGHFIHKYEYARGVRGLGDLECKPIYHLVTDEM